MKNRTSLWALGLLSTALFLLPTAAHAQACTNASFSGTFQVNGAGIFGPVSEGTLVADGAGNLTFSLTAFAYNLFPGSVLPAPTVPVPPNTSPTLPPQKPQAPIANEVGSGHYVVSSDCTMTLTLNASHFNCYSGGYCLFPIHYDATLVRGGTAFFFLATDSGNAKTGGFQAAGAGAKI